MQSRELDSVKYVTILSKCNHFPIQVEKKGDLLLEDKSGSAHSISQLYLTSAFWVKNGQLKFLNTMVGCWLLGILPKRALKDKADREKLVDRLLKKAVNNKISTKSLISNHGTKKYIKIEDSKAIINKSKIEEEDAKWDGFYGVITNIDDQNSQELLTRYRGLWGIEEAFRVNKHTLKMRLIYHFKRKRIESYIAICFLAYSLSYYV